MNKKINNFKSSKVNIVLVEIINCNLGDAVIADSTYYLLQRALPFLHKGRYAISRYNIFSDDYEMIFHADLIVFAGGGIIKYKNENLYEPISKIIECATENDIPVYFNAVGVEGYDADDERCQILKKAIRQDCVKGISVRDDLETLHRDYMSGTDAAIYQGCDSAVFAGKVYGICKNSDSNTIGIGIARHKIFADYGMPEIDKEFQLKMWESLIDELESRGYEWKLFVNGLKSDFEFADEILRHIRRIRERDKYLVSRPTESRELVETISNFKAIAACRMHANIIAYSLGIPSVGLVWNDKLKFWGELIGYPERFLAKEQFSGSKIANCLEKSISEGVSTQAVVQYSKALQYSLKNFVHTYGESKQVLKAEKIKDFAWQDKLVATALGGLNFRYCNMNSSATLGNSIKNGFKYLEADIRLTTDNVPVCVNGWSQKTYSHLGIPEGKYDKSGISHAEFSEHKYYDNHYPTLDLEKLLQIVKERRDIILILDIGIPPKDKAELYRDEIIKLVKKYKFEKNCIVRLQTERDVEMFNGPEDSVELMYFYPGAPTKEKQSITAKNTGAFAREQNIRFVSVSIGDFNAEVARELKNYGHKICVFSCSTVSGIVRAINEGADLVGTHYITVRQMDELL